MKSITDIQTLGELKKAGIQTRGIRSELRENLLQRLRSNAPLFPGIIGYDDTVIPDVERAILSMHHINLLGLRGQAKTRMARQLVDLLDEYIPIIDGSEVLDDPYAPISAYGKEKIAEMGDDTPVAWVHRSERYAEKLATPDVSIADLIGDIDPIKAANLKLSYADEGVVHYGMIPRSNRCIFVINEIPDLQARIQVALFNILEEGDVQIRGFKFRMPLDMMFVFTANPEDYTNRGSIITPLKDRIGSQILTHYPKTIDIAAEITAQESSSKVALEPAVIIPDIARKIVEQIGFEARESEFIDEKSGVSARLSISALENLHSTAERRMAMNGSSATSVRVLDFSGVIPAITGKVELVYEGEQEGAYIVAEDLIGRAIVKCFEEYFPKVDGLRRADEANPYLKVLNWFAAGNHIELMLEDPDRAFEKELDAVSGLGEVVETYAPNKGKDAYYFYAEWVLHALAEGSKLNKERLDQSFYFQDLFQSMLGNDEEMQ